MSEKSKPPRTYESFTQRFPELEQAWRLAREAEKRAPFDPKTRRLLKLAIAIGAMRQGAVTSGVRKARDAGATDDEIFQLVALAASTLGFPSAVAVFSWMRD